jgi:signal transduction histidine kinase
MPTTNAIAARLQAAFADLARGEADRSTVEDTLRTIGRDAEALGAGLVEVVVAFCEAADSVHATLEPRPTALLLTALLGAFETARIRQRQAVGRLLHMQEEERRRLAGEIHDDAIQAMAAAYMRLQLLGRKLSAPSDLESCEALERMLKVSVQTLRRLTFELRPVALDDATLAGALEDYLEQVEFEGVVACRVVDDLATQPSDQSRLVLYRAAQEVLTNVAKHAAASTVVVSLTEDAAGFSLLVEDDGRGFDTRQSGLGLQFVRERAEAIGGACRVESEPGRGTNVRVWVPRI